MTTHVTHVKPTYIARLNPLAFGLPPEEEESSVGLLGSWGVENMNEPDREEIKTPDTGYSDSFICAGGGVLGSARFWLNKPPSNVSTDLMLAARIYSGRYPNDSGVVAESDPINASTLPEVSSPQDFVFTGDIELTDGVEYSVSIEQVGGTLGSDVVRVGHSSNIAGNPGQWCIRNDSMGGWISQGIASDLIFEVHAKP